MLYKYLLETFGVNEPIFISDIQFDRSDIWISKELAKLCEKSQLIRYERGIYYIPQQTIFGQSHLNPNKVIKRKYLSENGNSIGFYSGISALQKIGLSTQMPNIPEIQTNNENSNLRRVKVGNQEVILRKARAKITNQNISVLIFLDIMSNAPASYLDEDKKAILSDWIKQNNITRNLVSQYAPAFPDRTMRNLVESGVIYYVT